MAQEEEGWPLGLRFLNSGTGLVRNNEDYSGSVSFTTMLTASPVHSKDSASDLDTQSTVSLFHERSITLGSLIGISSFLELSRRSTRGRMVVEPSREENKRNHHNKLKPWLLSLCSRLRTDAVVSGNDVIVPSLGHYLEAERRARDVVACTTRNQISTTITHGDGMSPLYQDSRTLFGGS
ncbi:hypothetical protein HN51_066131 [Arachis hypogaea]|uniref:uncharacterized protein At3g17950-like n=1 Tax=Arachis ipaensis TaxID=130454 RepID=UPI0007AFB2A6|nr:uncharacterized protein At3g17950-like [Arachis ipaensis]XP_020976854.1 uncharacterized protein At3g17950-like [Arachis ipaensis]XP_025647094.1 uncharacterized protein At3g17950 [Arachis hypogaea]QHO07471.1 uncharacterized protein DS421_14g463940 [Arachis hypogaea]QHO07472.1 uncharacterized protein DS421_14g463940 [Arachis hypogaea]